MEVSHKKEVGYTRCCSKRSYREATDDIRCLEKRTQFRKQHSTLAWPPCTTTTHVRTNHSACALAVEASYSSRSLIMHPSPHPGLSAQSRLLLCDVAHGKGDVVVWSRPGRRAVRQAGPQGAGRHAAVPGERQGGEPRGRGGGRGRERGVLQGRFQADRRGEGAG